MGIRNYFLFQQIIFVQQSISCIDMPNPHCVDHTCPQNCCNFLGHCLNSNSTDSNVNKCYYYYDQKPQFPGAAIGVLVAFPIIFIALLVIVCWIKRKRNTGQNWTKSPVTVISHPAQSQGILYGKHRYRMSSAGEKKKLNRKSSPIMPDFGKLERQPANNLNQNQSSSSNTNPMMYSIQ